MKVISFNDHIAAEIRKGLGELYDLKKQTEDKLKYINNAIEIQDKRLEKLIS